MRRARSAIWCASAGARRRATDRTAGEATPAVHARRRGPHRTSRWPASLAANVARRARSRSRGPNPLRTASNGVREVEALYLDMIAAARKSIYIENQYFTADKIGEALAARLREEDGPEVIVVLRELSHGWLEELTMQTLRTPPHREAARGRRPRTAFACSIRSSRV